MADEYFYGATLSEAGASVSWDPVGNTEDYQSANYKLQIKQILLGHTAKADEYNVVQVETMSLRDAVKIPIAVLKAGETRSILTDLEFPDAPVNFKLIEGSGPVHILGQHLPASYDIEDIEEMEEEILDSEGDIQEEDDEDESNPRKKAKLESNNTKPVSKANPQNSNNKNNKKK